MANEKIKKVDIGETFCEAATILIEKQLEGLQFDKTIEATITDTKRALEGIYTVSTGQVSFLAYADKDDYKKDEEVMVTIPQGDYDKQKNIISRKIDFDQTEKPENYNSAFSTLIDIVNNKKDLKENESKYTRGIKVNEAGEKYSWDTNIADFINSNAFNNFVYCYKKVNREDDYIKGETYYTAGSEKDILTLEEFEIFGGDETEGFSSIQEWYGRLPSGSSANLYLKIKIGINYIGKMMSKIFDEDELVGYTRLGVKADFQSFLDNYNTVSGNYGLAFLIKFKHNETDEQILRPCIFDSKDFFGDVYNFIIPQTQETVFDISKYAENYHVEYIEVYLYQRSNFINTNGQLIDTSSENNDIVLNNLYLTLGIDASEYVKDTVKIYTLDGNTYQKNIENTFENNKKTIKLNWIHKDDITGNISRIQNDISENYEIRWYYYKLGSPSADNFSGASWERFYGCTETQDQDGYYCRTSEDDIATNKVQIDFYPNVGKNTQQLKAIIIKKNIVESFTDGEVPLEEKIAESKIITFTNLDEVSNTATIIDLNALSIRYEDNEKGNYFLYDESRKIFTKESEKKRILKAVYDLNEENVYAKQALNNYSYIQWIFPANNTMIVPYFSESENNDIKVSTLLTEEVENSYQNNKAIPLLEANGYKYPYEIYYYKLDDTFRFEAKDIKEGDPLVEIKYSINSELDFSKNRNLVYLKITKDGQLFNASTQMFFNVSGTSGSNYNLFIRWDEDPYVFNIKKGELSGKIVLTDQLSQEIDINEVEGAGFELRWYKYPDKRTGEEEIEYEIEENKDIYYPIINNAVEPLQTITDEKILDYYCVTVGEQNDDNYTGDNTTTVIYDLNKDSFSSITPNFGDGSNFLNSIVYCKFKGTKTEKKKYKIKFEEFNTIPPEESCIEGAVDLQKKIFYYGYGSNNIPPKKRAFIKRNDRYIIDPFQEFNPNEIYYIPIQVEKAPLDKCLQLESFSNGKFKIYKNDNTDIDIDKDLYILEVILTGFENYKKIVARYPIPLKNEISDENEVQCVVDHINGPTTIRYSTFGDIEYNNSPYSITYRYKTSSGGWRQQIVNHNNDLGEWSLIWEKEPREGDKILPILNNNQLIPPGCYFKNIPLYGIKFTQKDGVTLWNQPIYVYRDNYPSNTLNQWNGQDIINNPTTGTILANGFSAGKKEDDNSFTGVILGDWSKTKIASDLIEHTGIYGFHQGAISYALKDDGTAFFGEDGKGRIYFDGKNAQIFSSQWKFYSKDGTDFYKNTPNNKGMMLDIDDGIFQIKSPNIDFNCIIDSKTPNFLIKYNNYKNNINKTFYEEKLVEGLRNTYYNVFQISSKSPYLQIGPTEKELRYGTNYNNIYTPASGIVYYSEWIRINQHGGWIVSNNYMPTLSSWLTDSSNKTYYLGDDKKNSDGKFEIFPDNMGTSEYHCWGDPNKFPFTGLVFDLTHGNIILGNNSEIKGYQTGQWGPGVTESNKKERVFHISNGATSVWENEIIESKYNGESLGYFILAETISKSNDGTASYSDVFKVNWNGNIKCNDINCHSINTNNNSIDCGTGNVWCKQILLEEYNEEYAPLKVGDDRYVPQTITVTSYPSGTPKTITILAKNS